MSDITPQDIVARLQNLEKRLSSHLTQEDKSYLSQASQWLLNTPIPSPDCIATTEAIPFGHLVLELPELVIAQSNPFFVKLLNTTEETLIGKNFTDFLDKTALVFFNTNKKELLHRQLEVQLTGKITVELFVWRLTDRGDGSGLLHLIVLDRTNERSLEQAFDHYRKNESYRNKARVDVLKKELQLRIQAQQQVKEQYEELQRFSEEVQASNEELQSTNEALTVANQKIEESQERFQQLSALSFEGILIHKNGMAVDMNKSFVEMTGYESHELYDVNLIDLLIPNIYQNIVKQRIHEESMVAYEAALRCQNGDIIPVELESRKIQINQDKVSVTAVRDIRDKIKYIESQKQFQRNLIFLNQSAMRFMDMNSQQAILIYAAQSLQQLYRDSFVLITTYDNQKGLFELKHTAGMELYKEQIEQVLGSSLQSLTFPLNESLKETYYSGHLQAFDHQNMQSGLVIFTPEQFSITQKAFNINTIYIIGIIRNELLRGSIYIITRNSKTTIPPQLVEAFANQLAIALYKQELIDELKELNSTKDKLFSIIAHDLRNPFQALTGFSSMILRRGKNLAPQKIQEYTQAIHEAADAGYKLLENLLYWARSQTGKIEQRPKCLNLIELAEEAVDLLRTNSQRKNITIKIDIADATIIFADENMIKTILRNLISNAIKFTPKGGNINVWSEEQENATHIHVKDDGIGISPENLKKLFRIDINFTQKGTDQERGTGLGLILCQDFVQRHGGEIWVTSREGAGSQFSFSLPKPEQIQGQITHP